MSSDISFESKDKLFFSIGIILISSNLSTFAPYITRDFQPYTIVIGLAFFVYSLWLLNKKEKEKNQSEYLLKKQGIAELMLKRQQMTSIRDRQIMDAFIEDEYLKIATGLKVDVKNINETIYKLK